MDSRLRLIAIAAGGPGAARLRTDRQRGCAAAVQARQLGQVRIHALAGAAVLEVGVGLLPQPPHQGPPRPAGQERWGLERLTQRSQVPVSGGGRFPLVRSRAGGPDWSGPAWRSRSTRADGTTDS